MRPAVLVAIVLAATVFHVGAEPQLPASPPETARSKAQTDALENLLSERESEEAFQAAVNEARKAGVKEQAILEARFLYHVDRREDAEIAAMLPDFLKQKEQFSVANSEIFSVEEDWLAVIEYVRAIDALKKGEKTAFKKHITEAFWLSPRQGAAFASHIERLRLEDAMQSVSIDLSTRFANLQQGGEPVVLQLLLKDKKALVLHFWSPWSQEVADSMPDFLITARRLIDAGVVVASVLPDSQPKTLEDGRASLLPLGASLAGQWITDTPESLLNRSLRIQTVPTMVILSPAGKVLFNGHPSDDEFWAALGKVDPTITRPGAAIEK